MKTRDFYPVNYCEDGPKRKRRDHVPTDVEIVIEEIKIKVERLTHLKRSIDVLNRQHDKKEVMDIDDDDIEEFNKLLEAKDNERDEVPRTIDECDFGTSNDATNDDSDELIVMNSGPASSGIITGITGIEIDEEFSMQYSYTTDVSSSI